MPSTSKLLSSCKRDALIFFSIMVIITVITYPFMINRRNYETYISSSKDIKSKTGLTTYSVYVFQQVICDIFYDLAVTCYLTVVMLFTSLTLKQVEIIQQDMIISADEHKINCKQYLLAKEKICYLQKESFWSTQILTFTSGLNVLSLMFQIWIAKGSLNSTAEVVAQISLGVPYLLKG